MAFKVLPSDKRIEDSHCIATLHVSPSALALLMGKPTDGKSTDGKVHRKYDLAHAAGYVSVWDFRLGRDPWMAGTGAPEPLSLWASDMSIAHAFVAWLNERGVPATMEAC